jgi:hypothetical protein
VEGDCGNPYRPSAYFSVTLNKPYTEQGDVKRDIVGQVLDLYRRFEHEPGVSAEPAFLEALQLHVT